VPCPYGARQLSERFTVSLKDFDVELVERA
jgi:hypothetical protein